MANEAKVNPEAVKAASSTETVTAVKNNLEALQVLQLPHIGSDAAGTPMIGGQVTLRPGVNLVPTSQLNELRKNPTVEQRFSEKIPRGLAPEHNPEKFDHPYLVVIGKPLPVKSPLKALSEEEANELIKETYTDAYLRDWQKGEHRTDVLSALRTQIDFLSGGNTTGGPAAH